MVSAILDVAAGKRYLPREVAARLANRMLREDLTSRELQVLELLAQGSTNKQIAHKLNISDNTVRCHVNNIMEKLQVSDRTEAVANALKRGVLAGTD
jgi:two-component system NarL family response regulator